MPPSSSPAPAAGDQPCCTEFAQLSRRSVLGGGLALGAATVIGSSVVTASPAAAASASSILVVLSLRGAADGLSLVVPHADPTYYSARPRIAIPSDALLRKDATFGLHPELSGLTGLWDAGELAVVHGTGLPARNRSHFAAMEEVEDANPGSDVREGWLNRLLGTLPGQSPLQGFNLSEGVVPTSLYGRQPVMSAGEVDRVQFSGAQGDDARRRVASLHKMWDGQRGPLGRAMRTTFGAVSSFGPAERAADNTASYPGTDLGKSLAEVARIIRGDVGVGVVTVDQGDWDHHSGLGTLEWGAMRLQARELAGAIAAFFDDLGAQRSKVTLVAFSEFGRRVKENASWGLDHGYGNVMFLAGAGVRGGQYYGTMPRLDGGEDADVPVTTDYRSVLSEIVTTRFGVSRARVFPGFQPESVGVMRGA
ncbi:MAG: hypothetical protein CMH83_23475 [Nocardioides sp.]|nr:hypothetical protein [Nocardioides sp.]